MITLLVMTDGRRDCIERTIPSAEANLEGPITTRLIYDDSGDEDYRSWLVERFGPDGFGVTYHPKGRQGFGGAIRDAWRFLACAGSYLPGHYIFHLEDDFTFNRPVDLTTMAHTLAQQPHLVQLALRRQPWNDDERAAGGIVEQHPDDFLEVSNGSRTRWLEHRRFFTTNPSLYRRSLCAGGWPEGAHSEGRFTHELLVDPDARFGFWGARDSGEWVTHIGRERVGSGY